MIKKCGLTIRLLASLALCLLLALLLAGTALGEVSREGLVAEWLFENTNYYRGGT
jgi:hypothetical protein